jgi:sugar phosphate isomerase/epimerase
MTIQSCLTICLIPEARGGPFIFWDDLAAGCRQAAELGFDAVEIFPPSADAVNVDQLHQLLHTHHLALAAIGTGAGWLRQRLTLTSADNHVRQQAIQFVRSLIDLAGQFGASVIIGSMQGHWRGQVDRPRALSYLALALDNLGERARQYGSRILFEALNRYETNLINTIDEAVQLLSKLSTANVMLLADLFHMNIEEADLVAGLRRGGKHIGHVHWVDSNRRPAGNGHIDFVSIGAALKEIGYRGYVSAEALPYPTPIEAARQTITMYRKIFTTL